jgi:sterol 3beta-glucosyltransferase
MQSDEWRSVIESSNFLRILGKMQGEMKRQAAHIAEVLPPLLRGHDLIIAGTSSLSTFSIAQTLNIPMLLAYVFPFTPTSAFAAPLVTRLPFGGTLNRLSFHIMRQMFWQSGKSTDTLTRRAMGTGKGSFWGPFRAMNAARLPTLYGYSRHVLPRPRDWGEHIHITGYWFLDEPDGWTPPPELVDFLDAGDPPVYIGFGSMMSRNPREAGEIALDALRRSGQRGVIASGWGGLQPTDLPDTVHMISSIPHSWLFPRMAAVVHHGGAGTTAAGLRAGVPSMVVPFMGDQPFWGERVAALGVGTAPIPRKQLTGERLAAAIHTCVTDTAMQARAAELGAKIRAEGGVENAVSLVNSFVRPSREVTPV